MDNIGKTHTYTTRKTIHLYTHLKLEYTCPRIGECKVKDFNNLKPWIEKMTKASGLPIYKVANRAGISRASIYAWMNDLSRPDPETILKVVQVYAPLVGRKSHDLLTEALKQYTNRTEGRPEGYSPGPTATRARR